MPDIDPICELIDDAVDKHQALEAMPDVITWHGSGDAMVVVNGERGGFDVGHMATWGSEEDYELTDEQHQRIERQAHEMQRQQMLYGEAYLAVDTATGDVQVASPPRTREGRIWAFSNAQDLGESITGRMVEVDNLRPFRRLHLNEWQAANPTQTVVAHPSIASRIQGLGIDVMESDVVPEGQVYVINQQAYQDAFRRALDSMEMSIAPTSYNWAQDVATFRYTWRMPRPDCVASPFATARAEDYWPPMMCAEHARERQQRYERRLRAQRLHRSYRHRCLARRRRNR